MKLNKHLPNLFIFKNLDTVSIKNICDTLTLQEKKYEKSAVILEKDTEERKIGFVLCGECEVQRIRSGEEIISLNRLGAYDSFGILTVFSEKEHFPTKIIATKRTTVLFISESEIKLLVEKYPAVSYNIIEFLAKKVSFLNKKIATFSAKSVEEKLALYLSGCKEKYGKDIPFCGTRVASTLGVGRASLYRALEAFQSEGIISVDNKKIYITAPEGLERKLK